MADSESPLSARGSFILLVESLVVLGVSIIGCAWVCIVILHRKWLQSFAETRRDRDIRRFLDFAVLVLMGFDLWQSINWFVGTFLAWTLYQPALLSPGHWGFNPTHLRHACKVVGGMTYFVDLVLYMWNAALAFALYSWVVRKAALRKLTERMQAALVIIVLLALLLSLVPAALNAFGAHRDATCWLTDLRLRSLSLTLNKSIVLPLSVVVVLTTYISTVRHLRHHFSDSQQPSSRSYRRLRVRLLCFMVVFVASWVMNSLWYYLLAVGKAPLAFGVVAKLYLGVGLYDAVVYTYNASPSSGSASGTRQGSLQQRGSHELTGVTRAYGGRMSSEVATSEARSMGVTGCYRIFATSYNCGGLSSLHRLGRIDDWIPHSEAYDVYAISLQECKILPKIRKAIANHLGGSERFNLFTSELGDSVVGNGKIALLVFVRASSDIRPVVSGKGQVAHGVNLGVSRFHNKGGVGLAFQCCENTSIAFIATHFASDSGGKKRLEKRNEDAQRTLRGIFLTGDEEDFDVHQQHHHVILMGDMNYRSDAFCDEVLVKVRHAAEEEMARHQGSTLGWREASYDRFFLDEGKGFDPQHQQQEDQQPARLCYAPTLLSGRRYEDEQSWDEEEAFGLPPVAGGAPGASSEWQRWEWVQLMDELILSMRRGQALDDFQEGVIHFPPTFKLWPGRTIEDYSDVSDLRYGYHMHKDQEARAPSWTDRILFYSLPDLRPRLRLLAYDACDVITGSDHRPVSAAFELFVDESADALAARQHQHQQQQQPAVELSEPWRSGVPWHHQQQHQHGSNSPPRSSDAAGGPSFWSPQDNRLPGSGVEMVPVGRLERQGSLATEDDEVIAAAEEGRANLVPTDQLPPPQPPPPPDVLGVGEGGEAPLSRPSLSRRGSTTAGGGGGDETQLVQVRMKNFRFFFFDDSLGHTVSEYDLQQQPPPGGLDPAGGQQQPAAAGGGGMGSAAAGGGGGGMLGGLSLPPRLVFQRGDTSQVSLTSGGQQSANTPPASIPPPVPELLAHQSRGSSVLGGVDRAASSLRREEDISRVVVLLPIPCEDPFLPHRRVEMLEPPSLAVPAMPPFGSSLSTDESPPASGVWGPDDPAVWKNRRHLHRYSWQDVTARGGLKLTTTVKRAARLHALLKFVDRQGRSVGQGVVCIKDTLRAYDSTTSLAAGAATGGGQQHAFRTVTVGLSVGGVRAGDVTLELAVSKGRRLEEKRRRRRTSSYTRPPISSSSSSRAGPGPLGAQRRERDSSEEEEAQDKAMSECLEEEANTTTQ